MSNLINHIALQMKIRQATIIHFCKDFNLPFLTTNKTELSSELISLLYKHKNFIKKYEEDYYNDKTPLIISTTINRHINVIELYLKYYHSQYFINDVFVPKSNYSLRYLSSYKIDFELGNNFEFVKKYKVKKL